MYYVHDLRSAGSPPAFLKSSAPIGEAYAQREKSGQCGTIGLARRKLGRDLIAAPRRIQTSDTQETTWPAPNHKLGQGFSRFPRLRCLGLRSGLDPSNQESGEGAGKRSCRTSSMQCPDSVREVRLEDAWVYTRHACRASEDHILSSSTPFNSGTVSSLVAPSRSLHQGLLPHLDNMAKGSSHEGILRRQKIPLRTIGLLILLGFGSVSAGYSAAVMGITSGKNSLRPPCHMDWPGAVLTTGRSTILQ